jgi:hypothetical protein
LPIGGHLEAECASRQFFFKTGSRVFVFTPPTRAASSENRLNYDGSASGVIIYIYVSNNPLRYTDPQGLFALPLAIPVGQALVEAATVVLGGAMIADSLSDAQSQANPSDKDLQQAIEKEANRREYKNICSEPPPPGLDPCERARWELNKAQSCKAARNANTNKWWDGVDDVHSSQLAQDLDRAIQNAQNAVDRLCKCQK